MSKQQWGDVKKEDRQALFKKIKEVCEAEGVADKVGVKSMDQFVGDLAKGEMANQSHCIVEGSFSADLKDKIEPLKTKLKEAAGNIDVKFEISASIAQGDPVGVIGKQTPLAGGDPVDVTHEEGQVILIDFWATWCPPCQAPMAHNQEMLEKRKADWGDKVRILGLSIDQDIAKLQAHVEAKAWTSVEHYHSRNGVSTADKDYGVNGVPHCLLVDTHGKIVFVGHPSSRKLEEDFDALLKGEVITGAGTVREGAGGGDGDEETKEITEESYDKMTTIFKDGCTKICADEDVKAQAAKLQRAYFVMVVDAKIDLGTMKMTGEMQCITQLFGDAEAAVQIQEKTKPISSTEGWLHREMIR